MTLYRYGWMAWVWRGLSGVALLGGAVLIAVAVRERAVAPLVTALPLVAPALYFGMVVAVRIDLDGDDLLVRTLLFRRRRIARGRIRPGIVRHHAQGDAGPIYAPRAFVPVQGGLPIYVDLLAAIPDRPRFHDALRLARP